MYQAINVGARIRYFRQLRGWSQEQLALRAGINPAFLGHLERGLKSPTITTLEKIICALDISMFELFSEDMPQNDRKQRELQRLQYAVQDLSADNIAKIASIVQNIVELKDRL